MTEGYRREVPAGKEEHVGCLAEDAGAVAVTDCAAEEIGAAVNVRRMPDSLIQW